MNPNMLSTKSIHWLPLLLGFTLLSCGDCEFEKERAEAFLRDPVNQKCEIDADCAVTEVGCLELESDFCGQTVLNKRAHDSKVWRQLRDDLADCLSVDTCATCNAALIPSCNEGSCR